MSYSISIFSDSSNSNNIERIPFLESSCRHLRVAEELLQNSSCLPILHYDDFDYSLIDFAIIIGIFIMIKIDVMDFIVI